MGSTSRKKKDKKVKREPGEEKEKKDKKDKKRTRHPSLLVLSWRKTTATIERKLQS